MSGAFVLKHMRDASARLLERAATHLPPTEVLWLRDLVDYGKFSRFHVSHGWTEEKLKSVQKRALEADLVETRCDGTISPSYPIDEKDIRRLYTGSNRQS